MDLQAAAQSRTDVFLKKLFRNEKDTLLQHVLSQPETYRYQLIYTQIDRDEKNKSAPAILAVFLFDSIFWV
jgi:hypothetical protein